MTSVVLLLLLGLLGLWGGTSVAIRGAIRISDRHGLSESFVGLGILAVGTDLPELWVALSGSLQQLDGVDASGVIVGSAYGSAIAQASLVLGVAGLLGYLPVAPRMVRRDGLTLIIAIALSAVLLADGAVGGLEGAALVLAYGIYFVALLQTEKPEERLGELEAVPDKAGPFPPVGEVFLGLVAVTFSAHFVVSSGVRLAETLNVSQTLLGVTLVGAGTSLPELALSIRAATEGRASLSVGNVLGSNIFDLLVPVGAAAIVHPIGVAGAVLTFDLPALTLISMVLVLFLRRRRGIQRWEAGTLLALYVLYGGTRVALG